MAKQTIGTEIGKGLVGRCNYRVVISGSLITVTVRGYNLKATETYKLKGVSYDAFDAAKVAEIIKTLEVRVHNLFTAVNKWGLAQFGSVQDLVDKNVATLEAMAKLGRQAAKLVRAVKRPAVQHANVPLRRAKNPLASIKV